MLKISVATLIILGFKTVALAQIDRRGLEDGTTEGFNIQGTAIRTRFFTVWEGGDPTKTRTVKSGYDWRVDVLNDLWDVCDATKNLMNCAMAGSCFDRFSCSKGCGASASEMPLVTLNCTRTERPFCSTDLLTLPKNIGPFTQLACGDDSRTVTYLAFTTNTTTPFTQPTPSTSPSSETPTSPPLTALSPSTTQTSIPTTSHATSTPTQSPETAPTNNNNSPPNTTPAIIGGVMGCLSLLCLSSIAAIWLIRRNRRAAHPSSAASNTTDPDGTTTTTDPSNSQTGLGALQGMAELEPHMPAGVSGSLGYGGGMGVYTPSVNSRAAGGGGGYVCGEGYKAELMALDKPGELSAVERVSELSAVERPSELSAPGLSPVEMPATPVEQR